MKKIKKIKINSLNNKLSERLIETMIRHTQRESEILFSFLGHRYNYLIKRLELKLIYEPPKFFKKTHKECENEVEYLRIQINSIVKELDDEWQSMWELSSLIEYDE